MSRKSPEARDTARQRSSLPPRWSAWAIGLLAVVALGVLVQRSRVPRETAPADSTSDSSPAAERPSAALDESAFAPTVANAGGAPGPAPAGMVWIPGGEFSMGSHAESEGHCAMPGVTADALPVHRVYVDGFWMDATEVTNEAFARFVAATGYRTVAERTPTAEEFPGAPAENLVAGSTVFTPTPAAVPLGNHYRWWRYEHGALTRARSR